MSAQRVTPAALGALAPRRLSRFPSAIARLRRIALVAGVVLLAPPIASYLATMAQPSNSAFAIRSIEWLRDNGAAGLVARVESFYYSLTAPGKGGPTLRSMPQVGYTGALGTSAATEEELPARVAPIIQPALPGEGMWHSVRQQAEGQPAVLVTTLRDQPEYPRAVVALAWVNSRRTTMSLNPGRLEPSVSLPRGSMDVPYAQRPGLVATFNSGFKLSDDHGGFTLNGHAYAPMQDGQATLVGYANGSVDVIDWRYGPGAPANVTFARQNLPLIVDEGVATANAANTAEWGATVGNATLVWRSGIGIDRHGNLIYAAGEDQTVASLAKTLIDAGAVRAMELDINSYWVSFITYGLPDAGQPQNLLPSMERSASRYLEPDDRDFFAVYAR
jgi:hypothetical protein